MFVISPSVMRSISHLSRRSALSSNKLTTTRTTAATFSTRSYVNNINKNNNGDSTLSSLYSLQNYRSASLLSYNQFAMTTTATTPSKLTNCVMYCTDKKGNDITTTSPRSSGSKTDVNCTFDPSEKTNFSSEEREHKLTDVVLSNYEKRKLVFVGMYKSMKDVPDRISDAKMHRAGDLFRIYINIGTAVVALIIALITIKRGQRYRKSRIAIREQEGRDKVGGAAAP